MRQRRKRKGGFFKKLFFLCFCFIALLIAYASWLIFNNKRPVLEVPKIWMQDKDNIAYFLKPRWEFWRLEFWRLYDRKMPFSWRKKLEKTIPFFMSPYQCKLHSTSTRTSKSPVKLRYGTGSQSYASPGTVFYSGAKLKHQGLNSKTRLDCERLKIFLSSKVELEFLRGIGKENILSINGTAVQLESNPGAVWALKYPWGIVRIQTQGRGSFILEERKGTTVVQLIKGNATIRWKGGRENKDSKDSFLYLKVGTRGQAQLLRETFPDKLILGGRKLDRSRFLHRQKLFASQGIYFLEKGVFSSVISEKIPPTALSSSATKNSLETLVPILFSPKNKATLSKRVVSFRWSHPKVRKAYILQLSRTSNFKKSSTFTVRKASFKARLKKTGVYYWRVRILGRGKKSLKFSSVYSFRIK